MSLPTFVAAGATAEGTGAVSPALPASLAVDDILLLLAESASGEVVTIADANGGTWAEVPFSPKNATGTRLTVYWSRYNGTQGAPTTNAPGDHILCAITAWRGCITVDDPWDVTNGGVDDVGGDVSIPGNTTTVGDCLVVVIVAFAQHVTDMVWTNIDLSNLTRHVDIETALGNDGAIECVSGGKVTRGEYGATEGDGESIPGDETKAFVTIALRPPEVPTGHVGRPRKRVKRPPTFQPQKQRPAFRWVSPPLIDPTPKPKPPPEGRDFDDFIPVIVNLFP